MKDEMGGTLRKIWPESLEGRDHWLQIVVVGRIILEWVLNTYNMRM
jgi:hypothetical protein